MKKFLIVFFLFNFKSLYSNSFFSVYYLNSSFDFSKYSISYARVVSTSLVTGFGFDLWEVNSNKTHYLKSTFELSYSNYSWSLKPFYFFKDDQNLYGTKISFSLIKPKEEILTTYGFNLSYAKDNKNDFSYFNIFVEKNFYDEFFIMFQPGVSLSKSYRVSIFDTSYVFNTLHNGFLDNFLYSSFSLSFARSFKPDFNSYLYINFDRLNSKFDDINSYTVGLRTYIDENSQYYLDLSYDILDYKKMSNEKIWKISLGGIL